MRIGGTLYFCFSYILVFHKIIYTYDLSLLVRWILADRSILGACYFRKLVPYPQTPTEKKVKKYLRLKFEWDVLHVNNPLLKPSVFCFILIMPFLNKYFCNIKK